MTGKSLLWKVECEQRRRMLNYYKNLFSASLILVGSFLLLEHLFRYEGFDLFDFLGHEYFGAGMLVLAFLLSMKWKQWGQLKEAIKNRDLWAILDEGER